jgi:hypothetical protein
LVFKIEKPFLTLVMIGSHSKVYKKFKWCTPHIYSLYSIQFPFFSFQACTFYIKWQVEKPGKTLEVFTWELTCEKKLKQIKHKP